MAQPSTNAAIRKYVSLRVALIGALVIALAGSAYYVLEHWPQRGGSYPASAFEVPQGASLSQIASELERLGVIESRLLFSLYARLHDLDRGLQAGNYQLRQIFRQRNCWRFYPAARLSNTRFDCPRA